MNWYYNNWNIGINHYNKYHIAYLLVKLKYFDFIVNDTLRIHNKNTVIWSINICNSCLDSIMSIIIYYICLSIVNNEYSILVYNDDNNNFSSVSHCVVVSNIMSISIIILWMNNIIIIQRVWYLKVLVIYFVICINEIYYMSTL